MNRFLKVVFLASITAFLTACKDDDSSDSPPPRDFTVQYTTEKADIETYLKSHYITVDGDLNATILPLPSNGSRESIWDQQQYPLQNKIVNNDGIDYTVYYLSFNDGAGQAPTRGDDVLVAYRGTLLDGTQFDYLPFPQNLSSLAAAIDGWQEIIPLFKEGIYNDIPNNPDPAAFTDYGAGVMFLPSGLAYYNNSLLNAPAYSSMVFSFKVYKVQDADLDQDGIINRNETEGDIDIADYNTDNDELPNYLDADDDGDTIPTRLEISDTSGNVLPFDLIPTCQGGTKKKHLDATCY